MIVSDGHQLALVTGLAGGGAVALLSAGLALVTRRTTRRRLTTLTLRLSDTPREVHQGRMEAVFGQVERAAERTLEEREAARSEVARLRGALDLVPMAVVVADESGGTEFANAAARSLADGRQTDALIARAVRDMLAEPGSERTLELLGPPPRTVILRSHPVDDGRRAVGVVAVAEDRSEQRRREEAGRSFVERVVEQVEEPARSLRLLSSMISEEGSKEVVRKLAGRLQADARAVESAIASLAGAARCPAAPPGGGQDRIVEVLVAWEGDADRLRITNGASGQEEVGVAVARRLAADQRGSVDVEPGPGPEGARFLLRLPAPERRPQEDRWRTASTD